MAIDANELVKQITADVRTIVRNEVDLAKSELIPSGKNAGIGAGMFGGAGYVALNALSLLFMAGGFGFGALFEVLLKWPVTGACALGFVIMAVILLIITLILALIGKGRFAKVKGPEKTIAQAQLTVDESKTAIARGTEDVKSGRAFEEYLVAKEQRKDGLVLADAHSAAATPTGHTGGATRAQDPAARDAHYADPTRPAAEATRTTTETRATGTETGGATSVEEPKHS